MINDNLKKYIKAEILPLYKNNDSGHDIKHIEYVTKRSLEFASQFENINLDMVYVISSFHDIGHYIDKDNHEKLSAEFFCKNEKMKSFFNNEQIKIIKEAIEDHRASLKDTIRSNYGKIISSADRTTDLDTILIRTHAYTCKHYPNFNFEQTIDRAYSHIQEKYGSIGYAKTYVQDNEFLKFKKNVNKILDNKNEFKQRYIEANKL